jgi:hypothetical protein
LEFSWFAGIFFWTAWRGKCSKERMSALAPAFVSVGKSSGLYPWSVDLQGSIDVRSSEKAGYAMLLEDLKVC